MIVALNGLIYVSEERTPIEYSLVQLLFVI